MVKEAFHNAEYGITVGGQVVNMIGDDKAAVSNSQKSLQHMMDNLNRVTKDCLSYLLISHISNLIKTEVMKRVWHFGGVSLFVIIFFYNLSESVSDTDGSGAY